MYLDVLLTNVVFLVVHVAGTQSLFEAVQVLSCLPVSTHVPYTHSFSHPLSSSPSVTGLVHPLPGQTSNEHRSSGTIKIWTLTVGDCKCEVFLPKIGTPPTPISSVLLLDPRITILHPPSTPIEPYSNFITSITFI